MLTFLTFTICTFTSVTGSNREDDSSNLEVHKSLISTAPSSLDVPTKKSKKSIVVASRADNEVLTPEAGLVASGVLAQVEDLAGCAKSRSI